MTTSDPTHTFADSSPSSRHAPPKLAALLAVLVSLGVSACGSNDPTHGTAPQRATPTPTPAAAQDQADADDTPAPRPAEEVADRPGCGELCQHAGPPAGTDEPGCPDDDSDKCMPCPEAGCAALLTHRATVHDGLIKVTMRCAVDHPCAGAFHVYVPGTLSGRLAASDFSVPPDESATVSIALTPLGHHVVSSTGDFRGDVYVFLKGTGIDELGGAGLTPPHLRLHSRRSRLTTCDQKVAAGANTSCPFAENVSTAYARRGTNEGLLTVKSPTTGQSYRMTCYSNMTTVYCIGGNDAFTTFPQRAADAHN